MLSAAKHLCIVLKANAESFAEFTLSGTKEIHRLAPDEK